MVSRRNFLQGAAAAINLAGIVPADTPRAKDSSVPASVPSPVERGRLFPDNIPPFQWQEFQAAGYTAPVTGIIYRTPGSFWFQSDFQPRPVSGMPLGGIDTGGLYLEGAGTFGYSSIFNHYTPPGGPINIPYLGIGMGGKVWVLTTGHTKNYSSQNRPTLGPPMTMYWGGGSGVLQADAIDYWGHYPVADLQFKTGAPVQVSLRAWSPFIPGDSKASNTPGAVFEIHLKNPTTTRQTGTLAFNFPGFDEHRTRYEVIGWPSLAMKPSLPRLGSNGALWRERFRELVSKTRDGG